MDVSSLKKSLEGTANSTIAASRSLSKAQLGFLAVWIIGALVSIFVPVSRVNKQTGQYYNYYGQSVEYEQNQRAYEEAQNGDNQNNANQAYADEYGVSTGCSWYQFGCRSQQFKYMQYNQNNADGSRQIIPSWVFMLGGTNEEMQRMAEENGQQVGDINSPAVNFVYAWQTVLFIALVIYGCFVIAKRQKFTGLIGAMLLFAQFSLMNLLLLANGVISTDEREEEDSIYGWFGQKSVLMAFTDMWYIGFCLLFSVLFGAGMCLEHRNRKMQEALEHEEAGYQKYEAPEVSVADKEAV